MTATYTLEGKTNTTKIIKLCEYSEFCDKASTLSCIELKAQIPQWYVVLSNNEGIIADAGVIENDFHNPKGLSPIYVLYLLQINIVK